MPGNASTMDSPPQMCDANPKRVVGRPINLAIIGCGEVTRAKHLPGILSNRSVRLVAAADIDVATCNAVADEFDIPQRFRTLDEALAVQDIDAVGICTPPGCHADLAVRALNAGKHVWVDKPMALDEADCQRIIEAARGTGLVAMVAFHMRFHRLVNAARSAIRRGELGRIESVRLAWHSPRSDVNIPPWKTRRKTGGGAIVEIAVHHFDLLRYLLGTDISEVFAMNRDGVRDDENAVVSARMADGVLVSGEFSERTAHEIEIVIAGTERILRLDCLRFEGFHPRAIRQAPGSATFRLGEIWRFWKSLPRGLNIMRRGGDYRISYDRAWGGFFDAIRTGQTPPATLNDGLLATRAISAAVRSLETRSAVSLNDVATIGERISASEIREDINSIAATPHQKTGDFDTTGVSDRPLLSVVVPTYNRPAMLCNLLESLAQQRFDAGAFEIIVIDDGGEVSLDATIAPFMELLSIRLVRQRNLGCAPARQAGIDVARGQLLVFTDDDCRPDPDWLASLYMAALTHAGCAIAGGTVNALQKNLCAETTQMIVRWLIHADADADGFIRFAPTCNIAFPAAGFDRIGGLSRSWRLAGGEDRDLCARWIEAGGRIRHCSQAQVLHHHALTMRGFIRQHFNYGRGARRFRHYADDANQKRPFGRFGSYLRLATLPFTEYPAGVGLRVFFLLMVAELATLAGMAREIIDGPQVEIEADAMLPAAPPQAEGW